MLAYKFIECILIALVASSLATVQARANWEPSALDSKIAAQAAASGNASGPESDRSWAQESLALRRGLCELGNRPRHLSEANLDLCVLQSL